MQEAHELARANLIKKKENNELYYDKNPHASRGQSPNKIT